MLQTDKTQTMFYSELLLLLIIVQLPSWHGVTSTSSILILPVNNSNTCSISQDCKSVSMSVRPPPHVTRSGNVDHDGKPMPMTDQNLTYGTAGFRTHASRLPFAVYRMGVLGAAVSRAHGGKTIGIMITASHNPEQDNGIKLVAPMGEMLSQDWEVTATLLANVPDSELDSCVAVIYKDRNLDLKNASTVVCGYDTRQSGPYLHDAVKLGVEQSGAEFRSLGQLTTPQLHYIVRCTNDGSYGEPTIDGYFTKLTSAFGDLLKADGKAEVVPATVHVDCANGIGANAMEGLKQAFKGQRLPLNFELYNTGDGALNHQCGADYVKIKQSAPEGSTARPGQRWLSLDGDADRIVYFGCNEAGNFQLLDGDRIALLFIDWLRKSIFTDESLGTWSLGIIQTAYANGAAMNYVEKVLKLPVTLVPTGVKHLHHAALKYDVGVYFEANGHGTIIFSDALKQHIKSCVNRNKTVSEDAYKRACLLHYFIQLINETVGDAISDMLAVEWVLMNNGWTLTQWTSMYSELPSVQIKLPVSDRSAFKTIWDETRCTSPETLQPKIDAAVAKYSGSRAFVRPSGTEDIVRIYVEAEKEADRDALASEVKQAVVDSIV